MEIYEYRTRSKNPRGGAPTHRGNGNGDGDGEGDEEGDGRSV